MLKKVDIPFGIQSYLITQTLSKLGGWDFMRLSIEQSPPRIKNIYAVA